MAEKKGRLTLYEDYLSEETKAELAARDAAKQAEAAKKKKDASLLAFKPTSLNKKSSSAQAKAKAKPKHAFSPMHRYSSSELTPSAAKPPPSSGNNVPSDSTEQDAQPKVTQKRGFNDWLANEDEEDYYIDQTRHERGGRKKKKKKQQEEEAEDQAWSWDDIYDPTIPTPFVEFSQVGADEINKAWKKKLYKAHERELRRQGWSVRRAPSEEDEYRPRDMSIDQDATSVRGDHGNSSRGSGTRPPAIELNREESADEIYARRVAMSNAQVVPSPPPAPPQSAADAEKKAKVAAQIAAMKAKLGLSSATPQTESTHAASQPELTHAASRPESTHAASQAESTHAASQPESTQPTREVKQSTPPPPSGVISAAPTFNPDYYAQRPDAAGRTDEANEANAADTSKLPGQDGFAQRLMKKLGWEKGQGLGASGEGITTALTMKADKRKKKPDAQGGGFVTPANMGKIVGGKKAKVETQQQDKVSEVIKLEGMLENMDVDHEIAENGLMQEIGDEMGSGYGKVERLFIWRKNQGGNDDVFVKFTSPLSAVRCIKGMDGMEFAGNEVKARFWDADKFEGGEYA